MAFDPTELANAVASPRKKVTRKGTTAGTVIVGLIVIAAGLRALYQDRTAGNDEETLNRVVAQLSAKLPQTTPQGLVMEKVALEQRKIVTTLRVPHVAQASIADPSTLEQLRLSELDALKKVCDDGNARRLLAFSAGATRRFVDADGKPLFEVSISSQDCQG